MSKKEPDIGASDRGRTSPLTKCVSWFRGQRHALLAFSRLQAGGMLDEEDLLSESLKRVAGAVERGMVEPSSESLTPYAFVVIRHMAIDWKRDVCRRSHVEAQYAMLSSTGDPPSWIGRFPEDGESHQYLLESLRQLSPKLAEVVFLRVWEGLSFSTIGNVLGIPHTTAQSRYYVALTRLKLNLKKTNDIQR